MYKFSCLLLFIFILNKADAQYSLFVKGTKVEELPKHTLKGQISKYNFSNLFTCTDNSVVYGLIGSNYQRIRIKLISVTKDALKLNTYKVYGKSMVKNNIDQFNGTLVITKIFRQKEMSYGVDDQYKNKGLEGEFVISGEYFFSEKRNQSHAGIFKGKFKTAFYLDKQQQLHYDDINETSDGYRNNLFTGTWVDYKTKATKICNWGDYRITNSGDLDIGAGEFSPADKYLKYGWQTLNEAGSRSNPSYKNAKQVETAKWWE